VEKHARAEIKRPGLGIFFHRPGLSQGWSVLTSVVVLHKRLVHGVSDAQEISRIAPSVWIAQANGSLLNR
jgi:hypothetical protein